MLFNSFPFIFGFLPAALLGFFFTAQWLGQKSALGWLVLASLFFYAWWHPVSLPLLMGSIGVNYLLADRIRVARHKRPWLVFGITLNLLVLAWFKYAGFLLHTVWPHGPALAITLPLAISFFTFQQIMVLAHAAADGSAPRPTLLQHATFIAFFPHLIAGPIVRPAEVLPQLAARDLAAPRWQNLSDGLLLFLLGLGKKLVLADLFGGFADTGFTAAEDGADLTFFEAWYAALSYALQIYFDFSAYSDMAIGLARMLNVRFPPNFDSPYQARDIAAFWRRWHITLGSFLRDFVYVPLGGSRHGPVREALNLLATMLLAGLWHGAGWNFVAWGGLHGAYLVAHRCYRRIGPALPGLVAQALTLVAVIVAWIPFRAASTNACWVLLKGMAGLHGVALPQMILTSIPVLGAIARPVAVMPSLGDARTLSFPEVSACLLLGWLIVLVPPNLHRMEPRWRPAILGASFALSAQALFFAPHVAPFLYFQF